MSHTVTLRLHELGPEFIQDLKRRYPAAEVEVTVRERLPDALMGEDDFWHLIEQFDWSKTGNDRAVMQPAIQMLAQMHEAAIRRFADILSENSGF
jgi:hypothetical protein